VYGAQLIYCSIQVKNKDDEDADDEAEEGCYHREDEYVATENEYLLTLSTQCQCQ